MPMIDDSTFVFSVVAVAAALMASNRVRFDVVALMVVMALMLSGILTVREALSGFGSSVVILVAGLLVIGEMLARTGVARAVGDWILKYGGSNETRLLILIMLGAGVLGAVMSSTAVVAIFIPIVLRIAAETNLNSSRMLMPMSYAALISGMLTLIATTPNIVVHEELKGAGFDGFGFFSFLPVGVAVLAVAVVYMLLIGRRMLSNQKDDAAKGERADPLSNCGRISERAKTSFACESTTVALSSPRQLPRPSYSGGSASESLASAVTPAVTNVSPRLRPILNCASVMSWWWSRGRKTSID